MDFDPRSVHLTELVPLCARRPDAFERLWPECDALQAALQAALTSLRCARAGEAAAAEKFVARVLGRAQSALELVVRCEALDDEDRNDLLGIAVKTFDLDPGVLVELLDSPALLARLSPSAIWCSDALWIRAVWLFEEYPTRRFSLDELVPAHLPKGVRTRAVLGAALDGLRLTAAAVAAVGRMFPHDAYIQSRAAPSRE